VLEGPAFRIDWLTDAGALAALEPTRDQLVTHALALAEGYNEPENARLMGHTEEMAPADVIAHYEDMAEEGARQFLLCVDGVLVGDADVRGIEAGTAEFAFMIAARDRQGRGLGTKFALMISAFAFAELGLRRLYASVATYNPASRRVFEKLGFTVDESTEARGYADEPSDIVLGIDREVFVRSHAPALPGVKITPRDPR
jgi:RimJ/RimL family protein N-acetyltransferase